MEAVTVEDCSEDEVLVKALLDEEQMNFSCSDDEYVASTKSSSAPSPTTTMMPPLLLQLLPFLLHPLQLNIPPLLVHATASEQIFSQPRNNLPPVLNFKISPSTILLKLVTSLLTTFSPSLMFGIFMLLAVFLGKALVIGH